MSEGFVRHLIAFFGTVAFLLVYVVGYASGARGWWWTVIGVAILYAIIYQVIDA